MNDFRWRVIVVSRDIERRRNITASLLKLGLDPFCASRVSHCRELIRNEWLGLIFCDPFFEDGSYRDITAACDSAKGCYCVVVALPSDYDGDEQSMRREVFGLIRIPPHPTEVEWMVVQAKRTYLQWASETHSVSPERTVVARSVNRLAEITQ